MVLQDIINMELIDLLQVALLISIQTIGITQWLKHASKKPTETQGGRKYAFITILVLFICSVVQTNFCPDITKNIFNFLFTGLALTQLGYDAIIKGIPKLIEKAIGKVSGETT